MNGSVKKRVRMTNCGRQIARRLKGRRQNSPAMLTTFESERGHHDPMFMAVAQKTKRRCLGEDLDFYVSVEKSSRQALAFYGFICQEP